MRATQKNRMSKPVIINPGRIIGARSSVSSGQPSVENGHRLELNQVSSTSGSCVSLVDRNVGHRRCFASYGDLLQSPQCHAGMRWPHQSWREMHQSRMFSIQLKNVLFQFSGTNWMWPSFHRGHGFFGQRLGLDKPLRGDERFHDGATAIAFADGRARRVRFFRAGPAFRDRPPRACALQSDRGPRKGRRRLSCARLRRSL